MVGTRGMPANYGGVETVVDVLARQLVRRGHDVTVFCRSEDYAEHPPMVDGVTLTYLPAVPRPGFGALVHALRATVWSIGRGFDVIHFHALGPGMMSLIARPFTRAAIVVTVHGRDDRRDKWGRVARTVLRCAASISARVPHATFVVSQALADEYAQEFGRSTTVVPNSINAIEPQPPGETLARFGLEPGRYFVSVGRLVPEKAPHELVSAHSRSLTDFPLVVVGGAAGTEDYVSHIREEAAPNEQILFTGPLYRDELAEVFTNAGAFVTASHLEGLPTALIEAGRAAVPIIASDIAPHLEILGIEHGGAGRRTFPVGDVDALAKMMEAVSEAIGEERFGAKQLAQQLDEKYAPARTAEVHERGYLATRGRLRRR